MGRQAQSKRLPTEAQDLDNVYCTIERSIERRLGAEMVQDVGGSVTPVTDTGDKLWYHWFTISKQHRFLIILNRGASYKNSLLTISKLVDGRLSPVASSFITVEDDCFTYLKHNSSSNQDDIKAVAIGTSLLLLNTKVKAGFTSDGKDTFLKDLDGEPTTIQDTMGYEVVYETSASVDPKGDATIWSQYSIFISGDQVIDITDSPSAGIYGLWRVDQSVTTTVGPENNPPSKKYLLDIDKGTIPDITDDPSAILTDVEEGWTYIITKGGTPQANWGTFYPENATDYTDTDNAVDSLDDGYKIRCIDDTSGALVWTINKWRRVFDDKGNVRYTEFIPVKDNVYPDPDKPYLGQSLVDLTKLRLPPDPSDTGDRNNAESMLKSLYPNTGNSQGKGKVYYLAQTYGTTTPGYYRIKNTEKQPYLHKLRTPDKLSLLDRRRMPMQLDYDMDTEKWTLRVVGWDERRGGTEESNPGPSPFRHLNGDAREAEITSMSFYRDRLFLSSGDIMFTSRLGDFDNFWIKDPGTITSSDPIDISVSSNKYSPITTMIPFNDYLFINTKGDTQFELVGSENQITPFTAEIAPTTFYSTLSNIEPQLMGNQIYFFDAGRLYIYFGQDQTNINQAIDISTHCPGYLPDSPAAVTVSPAHNSIYFSDEDAPNHVYTYINRFAGDQVVQNSFYRHILSPNTKIKHLTVFDNYLYILADTGGSGLFLQRLPLDTTDYDASTYLLDNIFKSDEGSYDSETDTTEYTLPFPCSSIDTAVIDNPHPDAGVIYTVTIYTTQTETKVRIVGDTSNLPLVFGSSYTSKATLSTQFVRDERNNTVNGLLNIRSMSLRHVNSGSYSVSVVRRGRAKEAFTHTPYYTDSQTVSTFPLGWLDKDGEYLVRIFGMAEELDITIESDFISPFNITNIEFRGKFNKKDSLLERR